MSDRLTEELLTLARENGAAAAGICCSGPFDTELAALESGRESGLSGPLRFTYDNPQLSTDVRRSFPWAERIVVVGRNYLAESAGPAPSGALVGRFATADHYNAVRRITSALTERLESHGYRAQALVDDSRLVDRAAAVRAGLGWSGKSTMVLAPAHGPWMLLGSVLTDAPLSVSRRMRRSCGTCVACFPACPTGALGEWGLDARRCLATWLQAPGSIPQWIRPILGRRVYGCDDCLIACPPGRQVLGATGARSLDLPFDELLALTDDALLERFNWWYVPRRQGRFIRRNLLVAAGNSGQRAAREPIEAHLTHSSSMIRGHAAWAMARAFGGEALATLKDALVTETVSEARDELVLALLLVEHPEIHRDLLAVDEWVGTEESLRALVVVGPHAAGEGGQNEALDLVVLYETPGPIGASPVEGVRLAPIDRADGIGVPLVRVHDPDRALETLPNHREPAALWGSGTQR